MAVNIVNLLSKAFNGSNLQSTEKSSGSTALSRVSDNPFANPFVTSKVSVESSSPSYGQNSPVQGGYFAGYYNGRANIVGQRLFIEA